MRQIARKAAEGLLGVLALCVLWELCAQSGLYDKAVVPPPSVFLRHLVDPSAFAPGLGAHDGKQHPVLFLVGATLRSMLRVVAGLVVALILAIPIGFFLALMPWANRLLSPILLLLAPLSPIAWIPLAMLTISYRGDYVLDAGDSLAIFIVVIAVVFLLTIATIGAVQNLDKDLLERARMLGARRVNLVLFVMLPAILPEVFQMLRVNFFAAWMAVLLAETVGLSQEQWGLGNLIWQARQTSNRELALAGMAVVAVAGLVLDRLLVLLQRRALWWRRGLTLGLD